MTFNQMRYFIHLAHVGSFTTAAQDLYISQPNLTKYIASMEKELGIKLFDRSTHHMRLTPQGKLLLQKVEPYFNHMTYAMEEALLSSRFHTDTLPLTIGVSRDEVVPAWLMDFLQDRNTGGSRYYYSLAQDSYLSLISGLRKRTYDMAISTDRNIRNQSDFSFIKLQKFEIVLAIHKNHPLAEKTDLHPTDFGSEPVFLALPDGRDSFPEILENVYYQIGGTANLQFANAPYDLLLNVQVGAGVAMVSSLVEWSPFPDIIMRRFSSRSDAYQCIAWRTDNQSEALMEVVDFLRSTNAIVLS